jgi:hypothetical protein
VNQHFFAQVNAFIEPVQGFFQFGQLWKALIPDGQEIDFKFLFLFKFNKILDFHAQVHNGTDALAFYAVELRKGHGSVAHCQLGGHPGQGIDGISFFL